MFDWLQDAKSLVMFFGFFAAFFAGITLIIFKWGTIWMWVGIALAAPGIISLIAVLVIIAATALTWEK